MNFLLRTRYFLLILCVTLKSIDSVKSNGHEHHQHHQSPSEIHNLEIEHKSGENLEVRFPRFDKISRDSESARSNGEGRDFEKTDSESDSDADAEFTHPKHVRKIKPLKSIFMGIYKNYKSTFLGNRTSLEYRKSLNQANSEPLPEVEEKEKPTKYEDLEVEDDVDESTERIKKAKKKKKSKTKAKKTRGSVKKDDPLLYSFDGEYRYNIGPGVNVSLDTKKDVVSVNLDEDCLKDILMGRWWDDNSEEGRGKKYEMISKILPLFILPFLIQSAIIPFLVAKLKLLLIKSILVGKLAIFLVIISAIRNSHKTLQTYEATPQYWAGEPSRRSEIYNGYRVEGRPTTWVN